MACSFGNTGGSLRAVDGHEHCGTSFDSHRKFYSIHRDVYRKVLAVCMVTVYKVGDDENVCTNVYLQRDRNYYKIMVGGSALQL